MDLFHIVLPWEKAKMPTALSPSGPSAKLSRTARFAAAASVLLRVLLAAWFVFRKGEAPQAATPTNAISLEKAFEDRSFHLVLITVHPGLANQNRTQGLNRA